jgi:hypothetical protein
MPSLFCYILPHGLAWSHGPCASALMRRHPSRVLWRRSCLSWARDLIPGSARARPAPFEELVDHPLGRNPVCPLTLVSEESGRRAAQTPPRGEPRDSAVLKRELWGHVGDHCHEGAPTKMWKRIEKSALAMSPMGRPPDLGPEQVRRQSRPLRHKHLTY